MRMQTKYTKTFKIEAVKKVMSRGPEISICAIARSLDVKISTLHGWIKNMNDRVLREDTPTSGGFAEKIPYNWSASERLQAVVDTGQLSPEAISEYCRKKGIFPHHIEQWKLDFIKPNTHLDHGQHLKELKKEVNRLNNELNRKEKALAEAAALLILKKKHRHCGATTRQVIFQGRTAKNLTID